MRNISEGWNRIWKCQGNQIRKEITLSKEGNLEVALVIFNYIKDISQLCVFSVKNQQEIDLAS